MLKASKTDMNTKGSVEPRWCLVDASGKVLGRLASRVATILQGKHRATYVPHMDTGDFVVVINAGQVVMSGRKLEQKVYRRHTGYVGHLVEKSARELMEEKPEEIVRLAVKRMLPKSKLGRKMFGKLKVYSGAEHPHAAQKPEVLEI